jgi:hypothetical protein
MFKLFKNLAIVFLFYFLRFFHKRKYYYKNYERIEEFYLDRHFYNRRPHGLSAMMRVKNDEDWIFYAIQSILHIVDEVVVVLQNCTDNTETIIREINSDKIRIYNFPFDSFPSGKYHKNYLKNSIFNRAYYYNYALSKTKYSYVWKWDGDHAAYEDRVIELRQIVDSKKFDIIHYFGYDIYGEDLAHLCKDPFCSNEPAIFRVQKFSFYYSGELCEMFSYPTVYKLKPVSIYNYPRPLFIHFKYAKGVNCLGKGWVNDWRDDLYFKSIADRKSKGEIFKDEYPRVILGKYFKF